MLNVLKILHFYYVALAGSKFSSGILSTMYSTYLYKDVYQGLKIYIYIYIYIYMGRSSYLLTNIHIHTHTHTHTHKHILSSTAC